MTLSKPESVDFDIEYNGVVITKDHLFVNPGAGTICWIDSKTNCLAEVPLTDIKKVSL